MTQFALPEAAQETLLQRRTAPVTISPTVARYQNAQPVLKHAIGSNTEKATDMTIGAERKQALVSLAERKSGYTAC